MSARGAVPYAGALILTRRVAATPPCFAEIEKRSVEYGVPPSIGAPKAVKTVAVSRSTILSTRTLASSSRRKPRDVKSSMAFSPWKCAISIQIAVIRRKSRLVRAFGLVSRSLKMQRKLASEALRSRGEFVGKVSGTILDHPSYTCELSQLRLESPPGMFEGLYSDMGRPSIPLEKLLRALLLQAFYSVRSERQLMEQLNFNMLFHRTRRRWVPRNRDPLPSRR